MVSEWFKPQPLTTFFTPCPTRLGESPGATVSRTGHRQQAGGAVDMQLPSFLQHLSVLEQSRLVKSKKRGRVRTYELAAERFKVVPPTPICEPVHLRTQTHLSPCKPRGRIHPVSRTPLCGWLRELSKRPLPGSPANQVAAGSLKAKRASQTMRRPSKVRQRHMPTLRRGSAADLPRRSVYAPASPPQTSPPSHPAAPPPPPSPHPHPAPPAPSTESCR